MGVASLGYGLTWRLQSHLSDTYITGPGMELLGWRLRSHGHLGRSPEMCYATGTVRRRLWMSVKMAPRICGHTRLGGYPSWMIEETALRWSWIASSIRFDSDLEQLPCLGMTSTITGPLILEQ